MHRLQQDQAFALGELTGTMSQYSFFSPQWFSLFQIYSQDVSFDTSLKCVLTKNCQEPLLANAWAEKNPNPT